MDSEHVVDVAGNIQLLSWDNCCVCDWPSLDIAEIWLADNDDLQGEMIIAVK